MAQDRQSVSEILDRLGKVADRYGEVSLGKIVEALGSRSYGSFLLVPALFALTPIGGIPTVPSIIAAIIVLFAGQLAVGRKHLWLPEVLAKRSISHDRLHTALQKLKPFGSWLDRWFHGRLPLFTRGPFIRVAAVASVLLALTVPPLELLPFASAAPMAAIAMFGLALLVHDGALMLVANLAAGVAVAVGLGLLGSGG